MKTPRDKVFFMYIPITCRTSMSNKSFTFKVIRIRWRSIEVKRGHTIHNLKKTVLGTFFCMYAHIITRRDMIYKILTSNIIKGHYRSLVNCPRYMGFSIFNYMYHKIIIFQKVVFYGKKSVFNFFITILCHLE